MREQQNKIVIPCTNSFEFISLHDIIRCEGLQNNTRVYLTSGEQLISTTNIGSYKLSLGEHGFFCCHKSHIINKHRIKRYYKNGKIELDDNSLVPVSRRKRDEFFLKIINKLNVITDDNKEIPKIS